MPLAVYVVRCIYTVHPNHEWWHWICAIRLLYANWVNNSERVSESTIVD